MDQYINPYPKFHEWVKSHDKEIIRIYLSTLALSIAYMILLGMRYGDALLHITYEVNDKYFVNILCFFIHMHMTMMLFVLIIKNLGTLPKTIKEWLIVILPPALLLGGLIACEFTFRFFFIHQGYGFNRVSLLMIMTIPFWLFGFLICRQKIITAIKTKQYLEYPWIYKSLCVIGISILCFLLCEIPLNGYVTIISTHILMNFIYWAILFVLFTLITNKPKIVAIILTLFAWFIGVANYELQYWRGDYIMFSDIKAIQTAINVAPNYTPDFGPKVIATIILAIIGIICIIKMPKRKYQWTDSKRIRIIHRIIGSITMTILIAFSFWSYLLMGGTTGLQWNTTNAVDKYGYTVYLLANIRSSIVTEPENYQENMQIIDKLLAEYDTTENTTEDLPTIIVIQNEGWNDIRSRASIQTNINPTEYLDNLTENTRKGYINTSTECGPTAISEFEVLNSISALSLNRYNPFLLFYQQDTANVITALHKQSTPYYTIAFHPYLSSGYNRPTVYTSMGFDEQIFYEEWEGKDVVKPVDIVTDKQDFEDVISIYETARTEHPDQPIFLFNVTISGHSPFITHEYDEMPVTVTNEDIDIDIEVTNYMNQLWNTDQAIKILIDYFSSVDEKVIIFMYGDHNPPLLDTATEQVGQTLAKPINKNIQSTLDYNVTYMLWTNFDIEEYDGLKDPSRDNSDFNTKSLMYVMPKLFELGGLKQPKYYQYLLDLYKEYPLITAAYVIDSNGNYHDMDAETDSDFIQKAEILKNIAYNIIIDKENNRWDYYTP